MESSAKGGASRAFAGTASISVMNKCFAMHVLALDGVASEIECIDKGYGKIMFRVCLYSTHQFIF